MHTCIRAYVQTCRGHLEWLMSLGKVAPVDGSFKILLLMRATRQHYIWRVLSSHLERIAKPFIPCVNQPLEDHLENPLLFSRLIPANIVIIFCPGFWPSKYFPKYLFFFFKVITLFGLFIKSIFLLVFDEVVSGEQFDWKQYHVYRHICLLIGIKYNLYYNGGPNCATGFNEWNATIMSCFNFKVASSSPQWNQSNASQWPVVGGVMSCF